ncbi:MAG: type II toxin-antitoxin system VapB family antitoxin [Melioribacteraceae bacterium]|jgi:antitoxin VapB|nr:type II toxin-antitoxin system VapB family antitoxin [Melioribacteraceae bacterium]
METVKIFQSGNSQAIRLPKKYRFEGNEALISKVGDAVIIFPHQNGWKNFFDSLELFSVDFMAERNQPQIQDRGKMFE